MVDSSVIAGTRKTARQAQLSALAAESGDLNALDCYVAGCRDLDAKDEDGLALIHHAACHGNLPLIRKLWENGANMNLPDGNSPAWKPVHYAIFHRHHEAEQILRTFEIEAPLPILRRIAAEKPLGSRTGTEVAVRFDSGWPRAQQPRRDYAAGQISERS